MTRGGNAEKLTFDWIIGPPKYGCEVVQWAEGFNKIYSRFNFGHKVALFFVFKPGLVSTMMVTDVEDKMC